MGLVLTWRSTPRQNIQLPLFLGAGFEKLVFAIDSNDSVVPGFHPEASTSLRRTDNTTQFWGITNDTGTIAYDMLSTTGIALGMQEMGGFTVLAL
jgi:hypothetical protein